MTYQKRYIVDAYLDEERYNPRIRATVPASWVVVFSDGQTCAVCDGWDASTKEQAIALWAAHSNG